MEHPPTGRREWLLAAACAAALVWLNAYVCRDLFTAHTAFTNSMQGFWAALARLRSGWFGAAWWPYWDCGMPFEFTYAPLVPALAAAWSVLRGVPQLVGIQAVTALAYILLPVTMFLMAWRLTRAPAYSFAAAAFYSLLSPIQLLVPDERFAWAHVGDARRFYLTTVWDETPHYVALAFLPLAVLFLWLAIQTRRRIYAAAAVVSIVLATLASMFGPTMVACAAVCVIAALAPEERKRAAVLVASIGLFAYALVCPWMPPSLLSGISASTSLNDESRWTAGSYTALALVVFGWAVLWHFLPRWTKDRPLQFFASFAYLMTITPALATYLHRHFIPQPNRYKVEADFALALLVVFASRAWIRRVPPRIRAALVCVCLALAAELVISARRYSKDVLVPVEATQTVEYRAARWAAARLPGTRVMFSGSVAQWANAFVDVPQLAGSSWSQTYNPQEQHAAFAIYEGPAADAVTWLKAYGAGAVAVSGPDSKEFWKPFAHPEKFAGLLPALWQDSGVTIYGVPARSTSLAHVVPEDAIVRRRDLSAVGNFTAALDNPALPLAAFAWEGRNRARIRTSCAPGQDISVQISYHPGWHARVNGRAVPLEHDGLGLIWLRPGVNGPCEVQLDYDGGWELRLCRFASILAALAGAALLIPKLP